MKELIAAALIAMGLANVSAPYNFPVKAHEAPRTDFICIGITDAIPSREELQARQEAIRAEEEEKAAEEAAEKAKAERIEKIANGKIMTVLATAYTHTGNPTATGVYPVAGQTIAVDPRVIPLGTHVLINGHEYIAQDTGGLIKGNRIDIFMDTESECVQFGAQYIEIEVLK